MTSSPCSPKTESKILWSLSWTRIQGFAFRIFFPVKQFQVKVVLTHVALGEEQVQRKASVKKKKKSRLVPVKLLQKKKPKKKHPLKKVVALAIDDDECDYTDVSEASFDDFGPEEDEYDYTDPFVVSDSYVSEVSSDGSASA